MYSLNPSIPTQFYLQIFKGKNKFSIEQYLSLKEKFFKLLIEQHAVIVDEKVLNLENLEKIEKEAQKILEISRSSRYISLSLKYKVADELFDVGNYAYVETSHHYEKTSHIKTIIEDDKIVEYIADKNLSEDIFRELFKDTRLKSSLNERLPFTIMVPLIYLDYFVGEILPMLEEKFSVNYKDGKDHKC